MPIPLARTPGNRAPRVIIYARVSRDQQGGRSVSQQLKIGRRHAEATGWEVVGECSDNDRSASQYATRPREDWPKVEELIQSGEADILWLWELSRGTRDRLVWAHLVVACQEHRMYIGLDEDLWDTTNPDHMRYLDGLMADSIHESGKNRKRVNRDASDLAEEGHPWGHAGYGFVREYDPNTGKLVRQVPEPGQKKVIEEIAKRLESGERPYSIAKDLNARKVPTPRGTVVGQERTRKDGTTYFAQGWTAQTIIRQMSRPALMGKRIHHGSIKPTGGWAPALKEERWALLQSRVTPRPRARDGSVRYLLSGVALCDVCGGVIRVTKRARSGSWAYRCMGLYDGAPSGRGHVERLMSLLDRQVEGLLFERFSDPDVVDAFRESAGTAPGVEDARAQLLGLQREMEALYAEVESGQVSRRMAAADEARIKRAIKDVEPRTRSVAADPILEALVEGDPSQVWGEWDLHQRREALRIAAEEIRVLKTTARGRRSPSTEESVRIVWAGTGS